MTRWLAPPSNSVEEVDLVLPEQAPPLPQEPEDDSPARRQALRRAAAAVVLRLLQLPRGGAIGGLVQHFERDLVLPHDGHTRMGSASHAAVGQLAARCAPACLETVCRWRR